MVIERPEPRAAPAPVQAFAALRHHDYRWYYLTSVASMLGDSVEHVISYWVMFQAFHSPALAGFAVISHWLPFLVLSVWMGSLADRVDCRKLIQVSQGLYMLATFLWGVLYLTGTLRAWHAAALLTIHGLAGVVAQPPSQLIIHDMVGLEHLQSAIRLTASSRYLAILLGPAVGGGLMLLLGPGWGLIVNVLIYVPLSIFLLRVPQTGHEREGLTARAAALGFAEARRILAEVRADRRIVTMIVLGGVTSLFVGNAFQAQMPEYAHHLGADESGVGYSILLAANALGAVVGAMLLESLALLRPSARTALVCAAIWAALMGLFPAAQSYPTAVTLLLLAGLFNIAFTAMAQTLVQVLAPARLRGRVVGLFAASSLGLRAGSGLTVGVLGAVIDIHWSLALSSAAVLLITLALLALDVRHAHPRS